MTDWISHRGESLDAPENSLAAFRLAMERDTDGVETDLHLSADNVVICTHDSDLCRICGEKTVIAETDFADLQRYDIGNNERIPRFSDLLAILKPGKKLYAEIKIQDLRIIPRMMAAIDASNVRREQLVVISFKRAAIKEFKTLYPDIPALLLVGLKKEDDGSYSPAIDETFEALANFRHGDRESLLETAFAAVKECSADGIDVRGYPDEIDETWVNKFHDAGMFFAVWTIDDVPTAQYLINIGVDSITSNCAAKVMDEIL